MANCLHKYLTFNFSNEELHIKNEGILSLEKILKQKYPSFFRETISKLLYAYKYENSDFILRTYYFTVT